MSITRSLISFRARWARSVVSITSALVLSLLLSACGDDDSAKNGDAGNTGDAGVDEPVEQACELAADGGEPDFLERIGCRSDFDALASEPLDVSIPGARSGKVVLDPEDDDHLYFQNSQKYEIHYEFVKAQLSSVDAFITTLSAFNETQYTAPDRRFYLGAITYYEGPKVWALELAPYDTASADMITRLFDAVRDNAYFGSALVFHPTSEAVAAVAATLPKRIPIKSTSDLYEKIDYQPLNLGTSEGQLRFVSTADLETTYVGFRDIVVLDAVPNDISVVAGMITSAFQTPLSHVNVLAQNRKTPNMGLRGASTNAELKALDGEWVKLTVGAFDWSIEKVEKAEADAYWEAHKPEPRTLPTLDLTVKDLRDIKEVTVHTDVAPYVTRAAIKDSVAAFGAKAANYSVFSTDPKVPSKPAFVIPVFYYQQFMEQNGFYDQLAKLRADDEFVSDPVVRDTKLHELRDAMRAAPVDAAFQKLLKKKLDAEYPGRSMRFRSSTNGEDLDGFPCAGCYDSHTGDPAEYDGDQLAAALDAIRKTWATVFSFRTYEEREYHSIDHSTLAMALLVHTNFPDEEANGVAITANPYDPTGNSPGFYVNVQFGGDIEVVAPPAGVTSDSFIYQYTFPNQPIIYLTHSSEVDKGTTVLTPRQIHDLGIALDAIHTRFATAYKPATADGFYSMDCEFKFDDEKTPGTPSLYIKQARPYAGRGE